MGYLILSAVRPNVSKATNPATPIQKKNARVYTTKLQKSFDGLLAELTNAWYPHITARLIDRRYIARSIHVVL